MKKPERRKLKFNSTVKEQKGVAYNAGLDAMDTYYQASLPTEEEIAKIYYEIQSKTCRDCTWQTTGEKVIHAIAVRIGTAKE